MSKPPENFVAAVEPRTYNSDGEVVPLVDLISDYIDSKTLAVRLVGEGKSTAIAHLQNYFTGQPKLRFLDNGESIEDLKAWDLTVYTAPSFTHGSVKLKLARWSRDDCIDYLLATAPDRCKSVMGRLMVSEDLWLASGSPRVLARTLDVMIEQDDVTTIEAAILTHFESLRFKHKQYRSRVISKCVEHHFDDVNAGIELQKFAPRYVDEETVKFLSVQTVRYVIATGKLIESLRQGKTPECLARMVTPIWIEYFASRLFAETNDDAVEHLNTLANKVWDSHSGNAASLLFKLDSTWQPSRQRELNLFGAQLPGFGAPELILENSLVTMAIFMKANLPFCSLANTNVTGSSFASANLTNSNLEKLVAKHADFSDANLRGVNADKADFSSACLSNANLERGGFCKTDFLGADLRNANLNFATLFFAKLNRSKMSGATLVGTKFKRTSISQVDLRHVVTRDTYFLKCDLSRSNFAGIVLDNICLRGCQISDADFSESKLHDCDLTDSLLTCAKLGDIVWTNCNLRGVDFSGCQFHYGSTRSGIVGSPYPSHGTRTGFYTDDYFDQHFRRIEDIRKASLQGCDLIGARVKDVDFYLVDLRGANYDEAQRTHFQSCGAILTD